MCLIFLSFRETVAAIQGFISVLYVSHVKYFIYLQQIMKLLGIGLICFRPYKDCILGFAFRYCRKQQKSSLRIIRRPD